MLNVSPFAVITIAPFVFLATLVFIATLGFFTGNKREARWLRKHMTIASIAEQTDQGLTPWVMNGTYTFWLRYSGIGHYELVNPVSGYSFKIGQFDQLEAMLKAWGYHTSWAANNKGTKPESKKVRKGAVTEVQKLY